MVPVALAASDELASRGIRANVINVVSPDLLYRGWRQASQLRRSNPAAPAMFAVMLSMMGALLSLLTAWLGGELINRLSVGVDEGAHVDAPSSLSNRRIIG